MKNVLRGDEMEGEKERGGVRIIRIMETSEQCSV
jgi:hypothetical protein